MIASSEVVIVAGEVSGDMYGAALVRAIREQRPDIRFSGIGGERMQAAGVELRHHARDMAVVGLYEVLRHLVFFRRVFYDMLAFVRERRPRVVILIDYPGFNLRFAKRLHAQGTKVIYYVCPQVWAWHRSRIPQMARVVDRLITIFPFEAACFAGTGLRVDFAGHPLVDETIKARGEPAVPLPCEGRPLIAILPGSRRHEIERLLPAMWAAARLVGRQHPEAAFVIACPDPRIEDLVRKILDRGPSPGRWGLVTGRTSGVLRRARAALVASGTATLEASLMLCPMVVVYRTAFLTYCLAKRIVHLEHFGMVNIVAGRRVCPELLQSQVTPTALADALDPLLKDGSERQRVLAGLAEVNDALGSPGAADKAASIVLDELA